MLVLECLGNSKVRGVEQLDCKSAMALEKEVGVLTSIWLMRELNGKSDDERVQK